MKTIDELREDVIKAARLVTEECQGAGLGLVEVNWRLMNALEHALDELDKAK